MKYEDMISGEIMVSLINEPLDLIARFEVEPLTARQIADRRWGMNRSQDDEAKL